ncbi:WGxxGxxG family protein [Paenibacillus sp. NFR01]|uniref:WGxxGxxG family protein n=1 Tax=Paenibacillus sp. NFR01 TaxID=1566279 RepID=UPI0008C973CB|nr:WGxxGxxG family protein [Paenibacillus sp. NFR01]SET62263.1 hypothetical protein SAMN03159358_2214 [Paenibacillus sp. NFR01]
MNKLLTSLACGTVLSMSILGVGFAENASGMSMGGSGGMTTRNAPAPTYTNDRVGNMDTNNYMDRMVNQAGRDMTNTMTGTVRKTENIMDDKVRTDNYRTNNYRNDNSTVSPLSNATPTGRYRATSTTANNDNDNNNGNWGWLGLIGLIGLAGMRNRSSERR